MSTKKIFTPEEVEALRANPYTASVTPEVIRFTDSFKQEFWRLSVEGCTGNIAFRKLGYDPEILGFERVHNITKRIRRAAKTPAGLRKGVRGIHMRLLHTGIRMNPKKIRRLMHKFGLFCPIRKANPYRRMQRAIRTNNTAEHLVNREFKDHGPRAVLLTDITYIPLNGAFCYLSTILDGFTKQILAYTLSESLEVDFVLETVRRSAANHGVSLNSETILHSDQGCHYTCVKFIQLVKSLSLRQSMSRKGNCWDNAPQESFSDI